MLKLERGRPADTSGRQEKEIRVYDFLDKLGVIYDRVDHEALMTMEACEEADRVLEATICKNLFLCTANKKEFYLLMIAVIGWFVVAETVYPSERIKASRPENLTYRGTFTWQRDQ